VCQPGKIASFYQIDTTIQIQILYIAVNAISFICLGLFAPYILNHLGPTTFIAGQLRNLLLYFYAVLPIVLMIGNMTDPSLLEFRQFQLIISLALLHISTTYAQRYSVL